MEIEKLEKLFKRIKDSKVKYVDLKVVDLWGKWRHVTLPVENFGEKTFMNGVGFDASNLGYASVVKSDMLLMPDPDTAYLEDWEEYPVISVIADVYDATSMKPSDHDPRTILKNTIKYILPIADTVMMGPEYEFHILKNVRYATSCQAITLGIDSPEGFWNSNVSGEYFIGKKKGYHRIPPFDNFMDVRSAISTKLTELGVPVKYHHHEVGTSQVEIELNFSDALKAADYTMLAKHVARNIAHKKGLIVTFMPKPMYDEAGNGMHVHQFLMKNERNIFDGDQIYNLSKICLSYIAGILKHAKSLMAFTNPTTNSYRRLVPGFEAPISPVFGLANRTAAIRIPGYVKEGAKRRMEFRTIDATCNPYLAYAAMILAGVDGIQRNLDPVAEGYGPFEKDACEAKVPPMAVSLEEACASMKKDHDYLKTFPEALLDTWILQKLEECRMVNAVPSPLEFDLYFDA